MPGKLGIVFFALPAFWLLWKSVVLPFLSIRAKQIPTVKIDRISPGLLLGIFAVLLLVLLHFFGSEFIALMKSS